MKNIVLLGVLSAFLNFVAVVSGENLPAELNGKLVALRGKSALPYSDPGLAQAKYIALYFSAGWCGPCHQFTPELVKFYNEMKPKYPGFEVVFVSRDYGANAMEKYMAEMAMPWPAVRYAFARSDPNLKKYAGTGIPCLVLLNENGDVISHSYVNGAYVGPYKVMGDLKKLLTGESGAIAQNDLATPAPVPAENAQPPKQTVHSPSGTDWDKVFKKKSP